MKRVLIQWMYFFIVTPRSRGFSQLRDLCDRAARDAAVAIVTAGRLASIARLHPRSAQGLTPCTGPPHCLGVSILQITVLPAGRVQNLHVTFALPAALDYTKTSLIRTDWGRSRLN